MAAEKIDEAPMLNQVGRRQWNWFELMVSQTGTTVDTVRPQKRCK